MPLSRCQESSFNFVPIIALPIDPTLPELISTFRDSPAAVLQAPPGAGKTTRVPPTILDAGIAGDRGILVVEPRRIAAR